jgi:hypothetical protein
LHDAEQDFPITNEAEYGLALNGRTYEIKRNGEVCYSSDDISKTIFSLMWLIHRDVLGGITDRIRIHSGCGEWEGRRFIVVGDKGAGKTTLMVRLLYNRFRILSDELALVRDGKALPFPRRFHIKQESTRLLPALTDLFDTLPFNWTSYGHKMYSFTPRDAGYGWRIDEGDVRAVIYLEPNHGGESRIEECPKYRMVEKVMPMSFLSERDDHLKIGGLCGLIDNAECWVLHVGDLEGAVLGLQQKLSVL